MLINKRFEVTKDEVGTPTVFSSVLRRCILCFNLEAVVAVGVGVGPVGAPLDDAAGQVVEGHNGDGKYRYYTEEDNDGEYPVRVRLQFGFGEEFLMRAKIFTLISLGESVHMWKKKPKKGRLNGT